MLRPPKLVKILIYTAGVLLLLLVIIIAMSVRPVDYTPYFQTEYYQSTIERLAQLTSSDAQLTRGPLLAGLGRASLTPRLLGQASTATNDSSSDDASPNTGAFKQVPLAGYGARKGKPATGVHDSLFASVVAVRVGDQEVVLVATDALIVTRDMATGVVEQLRNTLDLERDQILFSATHTHSGPGAWGKGFLAEQFAGRYNPEVLQWMIHQIATAIRRAHEDLTPATFGHGEFTAPALVRNRLVGKKGWIDDGFSYAVFRQADGDYAILGSYAAHATVLPAGNMLFSADYCGYWRRAIERSLPGMALFFAGGVGSHAPRGEGKQFERARYIGESLADSLLPRISALQPRSEVSLFHIGLPVDLPSLHLRITDNWRLASWLARKLVYEDDSYLQLVAIDDLLWVGAPCDFSGEMASRLKDFARRQDYRAVFTSFNGSYVGYLIPGKYYHYNSYESRLMSFFGPYMGDYFDELIRRMMAAAMQRRHG